VDKDSGEWPERETTLMYNASLGKVISLAVGESSTKSAAKENIPERAWDGGI